MNIFLLDYDKTKAAQYAVDRHVVKMPTETAQLLINAVLEKYPNAIPPLTKSGNPFKPLSKSQKRHPCTLWTLSSEDNFKWLCEFGIEQAKEYTYRYGRRHFSQGHIEWASQFIMAATSSPANFPFAMPEHIAFGDPVLAYRRYYNMEKRHLFKWKKREVPDWIIEYCEAR